jgi:hypothetical protein
MSGIGVRPLLMDKYPFTARAPTHSPRPGPEQDALYTNGSWVPIRGIREWGFLTAEDRDRFLADNKDARRTDHG